MNKYLEKLYNSISTEGFKDFPNITEAFSCRETVLYSFDVITATYKRVTLNLDFENTSKVEFQSAYKAFWYTIEKERAFESYSKALKALSEEEEEAFNNMDSERQKAASDAKAALKTSFDAMEILPQVDSNTIPFTIRLLVYADKKVIPQDNDVKMYMEKVQKALIGFEALPLKESGKRDLKALREALNPLCENLWRKAEGIISEYRFHCNARLTEDVFRVYYKGITRNKAGGFSRKYSSDSEIMREVVFAMFRELIHKREENRKAEEAKKQAEKDELPDLLK